MLEENFDLVQRKAYLQEELDKVRTFKLLGPVELGKSSRHCLLDNAKVEPLLKNKNTFHSLYIYCSDHIVIHMQRCEMWILDGQETKVVLFVTSIKML